MGGARLFRALEVGSNLLKSILNVTGSQRRYMRICWLLQQLSGTFNMGYDARVGIYGSREASRVNTRRTACPSHGKENTPFELAIELYIRISQ